MDVWDMERLRMINSQLITRGITQERVLNAVSKVPRHLFVPKSIRMYSYSDRPLSIGYGQTISQPYIVAYMTELMNLSGVERVLEIGTGSGYHTALLSLLARKVYTMEINERLLKKARLTLVKLGYHNIEYRVGDGSLGWDEEAPFDAICVTAAPYLIPPLLLNQLASPGRMVIPIGEDARFHSSQELKVIIKTEYGLKEKSMLPVRFVSMISDRIESKFGKTRPEIVFRDMNYY